ncbi:4-hydroxythreonine-4-phosphate dehydrogenase PdxA [Roseovarius sp. SCSIO 43702]|uniref:4-hydroxythreonine-4-phosphate dehydrogenase PdxA n=1 Tax=Roseovarius sp. SCSIO 43702 TaxID=2823043 RepID=UPI001C72DA1C|nr:4-hydroxythreonine-4-phosphate dehydrogenase PdxA [Roseovarius sp. SCSIO 43702]QYX55596.1 4-hydroxythreonine-4-phosphate dehydrogenase PdxA [Roseovarius sp. SCSIO 43702]
MKPVALTSGEPAGIGPELAAKAWTVLRDRFAFFWIGDPSHLPRGTRAVEIAAPDEAGAAMERGLPVLPQEFDGPLTPGTPNPRHAACVVSAIETAVRLVRVGEASALCTAPIHKKALQDGAGFAFPGHTEFLSHLAGGARAVMMLASDQLRVVPVTIHMALAKVPGALTPALLDETIRITHAALIRDFGLPAPRLAVAGLNPHAGEGGNMGREEIEIIAPVLETLRREGIGVTGPMSADTMFHAAARTGYDAAIAMYHDQALIPIKTLDFDRGVNVTLGLPFIRTSPDHGTALDIAGQGIANPTSTVEALMMAARMAAARAA